MPSRRGVRVAPLEDGRRSARFLDAVRVLRGIVDDYAHNRLPDVGSSAQARTLQLDMVREAESRLSTLQHPRTGARTRKTIVDAVLEADRVMTHGGVRVAPRASSSS